MPFRDPDELLKTRVARLEEELHAHERAIEALKLERGELHDRLGRALELLEGMRNGEPVKPAEAPKVAEVKKAIAEAKEKLPEPTPAEAPSPPSASDAEQPRPRRHKTIVFLLAAAALSCGLLYKKYGPKPVLALELGRARLRQPRDVVKSALGEGAREADATLTLAVLVAGEPASCSYAFLGDPPVLSQIHCFISQMPTPEENDVVIDRVIDAFEERLGWADSAGENDYYGGWRHITYTWEGGGAVFELMLQSPQAFTASLKLEDHDDIVQRDAAKRSADYAREQAEKQRQEREEERRRLQGQ